MATPEKTVNAFMEAWGKADWDAMAKLCVPAKELESECEKLYGVAKLRTYALRSLQVTNDTAERLCIFNFCIIPKKQEIVNKQRTIKLKRIQTEWKVIHNTLFG